MKTINKQAENMGGVIRIWAIPQKDYSLSGETLTINEDANMVEIYTKEDSSAFSEDPIDGSAFKTEITAIVPCDNQATITIIRQLERVLKYNVIFQDGNGNFKLAGNKDVPLRFSAKMVTGSTAAALNHYAISFLAKAIKERAVFISDPFES